MNALMVTGILLSFGAAIIAYVHILVWASDRWAWLDELFLELFLSSMIIFGLGLAFFASQKGVCS